MSRILNKLIRIAQEEHCPVFIYDSIRDEASVLMDLESYERGSFGIYNFHNLEEEKDNSFDEEFDDTCTFLDPQDEHLSFPSMESLDQLEGVIHEEIDAAIIEQKNRDLALYQARREEKEREEIAKVLQEELDEEPLSDPFEEDFIRPAEWHNISAQIPEDLLRAEEFSELPPKQESEKIQEPSYHPLPPLLGQRQNLDWDVWTEESQVTRPVPYRGEIPAPLIEEAPVFLEEPLS